MISRDDFLMGRDEAYPLEFTPEISASCDLTIALVNQLLYHFGEDRKVNSGWRPAEVNAAIPNAARFSKHMLGQACDLDDPEGDLDAWCLVNKDNVLAILGLWLEHPASTKGWCHVQTVAPKSGNRVFYP
jgi:hypothetical protein